ncbi:MAG: ribosome recycling factor, partial [Acidobacteria bacterium]|nr:ribosome recycling factor [Acidobacteriota bacterium]
MKEINDAVELQMKQVLEHLHAELRHLRTGRASLQLLDPVMVDYFGTPTPLRQVATLSVVDATMLMAQPWDTSQIAAIDRAIRKADLGLNPTSDGKVLRIPVPSLTEERRKELVRKAHDLAENARNAVRQARRDGKLCLRRWSGAGYGKPRFHGGSAY